MVTISLIIIIGCVEELLATVTYKKYTLTCWFWSVCFPVVHTQTVLGV